MTSKANTEILKTNTRSGESRNIAKEKMKEEKPISDKNWRILTPEELKIFKKDPYLMLKNIKRENERKATCLKLSD